MPQFPIPNYCKPKASQTLVTGLPESTTQSLTETGLASGGIRLKPPIPPETEAAISQ